MRLPYCKRAKFAAESLVINWCRLHGGGSPCTCNCRLCRNGGCSRFIPWSDVRSVTGLGDICDKLLCAPEPIFELLGYQRDNGPDGMNDGDGSHDGILFAPRRECVYGTCPTCNNYVFPQCPRHRQTSESADGTGRSTDTVVTVRAGHHLPGQVSICHWKIFGTVDEAGRPVEKRQTFVTNNNGDRDNGDDRYVPAARKREGKARQVGFCCQKVKTMPETYTVYVKVLL